ncbi:MAG: toxin-antitoxin system, toxin component, PIN family protein [Leptospirales bacterium]
MKRYSHVPMDLADASILLLSEEKKITDIITFDSDYYIYKLEKKKSFNNLMSGHY